MGYCQRSPAKQEACNREPLKAAFASEQSRPVETLICLLVFSDIQPHGGVVVSDRRHPIVPSPEVLPDEALSPTKTALSKSPSPTSSYSRSCPEALDATDDTE
jgi:hypothetical protein